jgi:hypothetical protein
VGHASRYSGLLHVEASLDRVFQSGLKTGGGATMCGACDTIVEVALEASKDGWVDVMDYVGPCYLTFAVFNVLGPSGIIVI